MAVAENPTSPIAGEPALIEALGMIDDIIDQHLNPHLWLIDEATKVDDLKDLRATMHKAMDAMRSETETADDSPADDPSEGLCYEDGDYIMAQDKMPADYWHGEFKAEEDAERQADAAYELAAELASCDWEGWD